MKQESRDLSRGRFKSDEDYMASANQHWDEEMRDAEPQG